MTPPKKRMPASEEEWKHALQPEQYRVLRCSGTEPAFTGAYWNTKEEGVYLCAGCGARLFSSDTKYDSGTGWPSFWKPMDPQAVKEAEDLSEGMRRVEVKCAKCGGHLGHVFPDGPRPTGRRYCINSAALQLEKAARKARKGG